MMKLAVMQPYLFPYIGYFQLLYLSDTFVVLDDVNYINKGFINRNYLLVNGQRTRFTIQLAGASQNRKIDELEIVQEKRNVDAFLKTLSLAYGRAPCFDAVFPMVEQVMTSGKTRIADIILDSLRAIAEYLSIDTDIVPSARAFQNGHLKDQERIIDICRRAGASQYINLPGGAALYDREAFSRQGIELRFIQPGRIEYPQFGGEFVSNLSILDVLFFNPRERARTFLKEYTLD